MARTRRQRQVYADLLDRYGRQVADSFLRAIDNLRSAAEVARLTAAIEAGQIEEALDALHIDPEAFNEVADRLRDAHAESGRATAEAMPRRNPDGTALVVRFDGRNPEAEAWLSRHSSELITRITEEQRGNVRTALSEAFSKGTNPRQAALDIVGRTSRATGKREGGILGLSKPQAEYVARAREELTGSDPKALSNYLSRKRRDRRFDKSVLKAIREKTALPPEIAAKALTAYERRLVQLRGEMIAKHETFAALSEARDQAYRQAVSSGKVSADAVTKTWRHFASLDPRHQHAAMNGKAVKLMENFVLPDGTIMKFPHDPAAPVSHTAGCRCQADYRINWLAGLK